MNRRILLAGVCPVLAGMLLGCTAAQAQPPLAADLPDDWNPLTEWTLDESVVAHTLHVAADDAIASDDNPGSAEQPLRTVQRAIDLAQAHAQADEGTRIVLAPGVYRETVDITERGRNPVLVIEAAEPGSAVISGSDVFAAWQADEGGVYHHAWPHRFGWVDNPWPGLMPLELPGLRRELLFIDGQPLRQVFDAADLAPGTYLINEDAARLSVYPPVGVDLVAAKVEASVRPAAKYGEHSKLLRAMKIDNLVLRGIVFEHAASLPFHDEAVALRGCRNVVVEDCVVRHNNGVGFGGEVTNATIRRLDASANGTLGMSGSFSNALIENCKTNDNNWRGSLFGATGWAPCGFKFAGVQGMVLRDHQAHRNHASGGWFDDSNQHVLIERFHAANNYRSGLSLEANVGPIVVRDAFLAGNSTGLNGFDTANVLIVDSLIADNQKAQIRLAGSSPLPPEELAKIKPDWRRHRLSGRRAPTDWALRNTLIASTARAHDAVLINYWMRGSYRDEQDTAYLQRVSQSLKLDGVAFAAPNRGAPLFPAADGSRATWKDWSADLPIADAHWITHEQARSRVAAKAKMLGHEITGFDHGFSRDEDPGL